MKDSKVNPVIILTYESVVLGVARGVREMSFKFLFLCL